MAIRNPMEWGAAQLRLASRDAETFEPARPLLQTPRVRRIGLADVREALALGLQDFTAARSDVVFLCLLYPLVGLILARVSFGYGVLPVLFPLAGGFALLGPLFAVGLNEMSRRREQGLAVSWADVFGVLRSRSLGSIVLLGLGLVAIFLMWQVTAALIYNLTLGPALPTSAAGFLHDVFTTPAGWALIVFGVGAGFVYAVVVLAMTVVSFPLLLDRTAGLEVAVTTSVRAFMRNPATMVAWGIIVAAGLVLGSIPLLLGLAVVLPVLGHATWHLYRKLVMA
jgi:uncharacterized membrane protein